MPANLPKIRIAKSRGIEDLNYIAFIARDPMSSQQTCDLMTDLILLPRKSNLHLVNLQTASGAVGELPWL